MQVLARALFVATLLLGYAGWAAAQSPTPTAADLFDAQRLQTIRLVVNPRDWETLKADFELNTYYPAHFTWEGQMVKNVGIRSRGTGSRSGVKPGLRIDFNRFDPGQHFLGLKSLVLRNNVQDASNLHERLAMQVFTRLGIAAPREAHVRLYVNDVYAGLYSVVESVDKVFLSDRFHQSEGYLYEFDYDPADPPYLFGFKGTNPAFYSPKPFKPVTHETDPDPRPLAEMIRVISETPDADFTRAAARYVDLDAFVAYTAVEACLAETDGMLGDWGMNNFYLYRFEGSTLSTLVPWDKSESFKGGVGRSIWHNVDDVPAERQNVLMTRAMRVPALRGGFLDTLLRCADLIGGSENEGSSGAPSQAGWLEQEILAAYVQIRDAAFEDALKPYSNDQFDDDVRSLIDFARHRAAYVHEDVRRSPR
jgi:spore coat protein CotH